MEQSCLEKRKREKDEREIRDVKNVIARNYAQRDFRYDLRLTLLLRISREAEYYN